MCRQERIQPLPDLWTPAPRALAEQHRRTGPNVTRAGGESEGKHQAEESEHGPAILYIESSGLLHEPAASMPLAHSARKFGVRKAEYQLMGVIPWVV